MKLHFLHNLIARKFPKSSRLSIPIFLFANVVLINVFDLPRTSQARQVVDYKHFYFIFLIPSAFNREIFQVLNERLS